MDPRHSSSRPTPQQSHLRPPPHHRPLATTASSAPPASAPPRAPVTAHPTATISDSAVFQGPHRITIGSGSIIHPRARIYSHDGPVVIGDGCIISEKASVGIAPGSGASTRGQGRARNAASASASGYGEGGGGGELPIRISANVTIGPVATVHPGVQIHSAAVVDALAIVHRRVSIGAHAKICARCEVPTNTKVPEWAVVWGIGAGFGIRRKIKVVGKKAGPVALAAAAAAAAGGGSVQALEMTLEGRAAEDARMVGLHKEREVLVKYIASSGGGRRR